MKTNIKQILSITSLAFITAMCVVACKDEVLVPVKDNTRADSLVTLIQVLDKQKTEIDKKTNTIKITNAIFNDSIDNVKSDIESEVRTVEYTINVLNGGNTITSNQFNGGGARTKGVDGATVIVSQNGVTASKTTADGRAIFTGLKGGTATVQISAANFATINAQVYLGEDDIEFGGDGAVRTAATNFLLVATGGGSNGLTLAGNLYINKNILDDTLGHVYGGDDAGLVNTYVSNRSIYDDFNYGAYNFGYTYYWLYSIYGITNNNNYAPQIKWDALTSGSTVVAYPDLGSYYAPANNPQGWNSVGYIMSISYVGLINTATVNASGAYTINVPYIFNGAGDGCIGYYIEASQLVDKLTSFGENSNGTSQSVGSVKTKIKFFDVDTYETTEYDRYVLTKDWTFEANISDEGGYEGLGSNGYVNGTRTTPGSTIHRSIFYFPIYPGTIAPEND